MHLGLSVVCSRAKAVVLFGVGYTADTLLISWCCCSPLFCRHEQAMGVAAPYLNKITPRFLQAPVLRTPFLLGFQLNINLLFLLSFLCSRIQFGTTPSPMQTTRASFLDAAPSVRWRCSLLATKIAMVPATRMMPWMLLVFCSFPTRTTPIESSEVCSFSAWPVNTSPTHGSLEGFSLVQHHHRTDADDKTFSVPSTLALLLPCDCGDGAVRHRLQKQPCE